MAAVTLGSRVGAVHADRSKMGPDERSFGHDAPNSKLGLARVALAALASVTFDDVIDESGAV